MLNLLALHPQAKVLAGQILNVKNVVFNKFVLLLFLSALTSKSFGHDELPREVRNFIWERDICEHFLGEDYEPRKDEDDIWIKRREYVYDSIILYCSGTGRKLKILKKRFSETPTVMAQINKYEECTEEKCD